MSEIWIYEYETPFYNLKKFDSFFCCRDTNKSGGVAVYVKKDLNIFNDGLFCMNTAETILLYDKYLDFTIICIYRSLSFKIDSFTEELSCKLKSINSKNVILIGDLNIDLLTLTNSVQEYQDILCSEGFEFLINEVTRPNSNSCIDHLIFRNFNMNAKYAIFKNELTDHYPILCKLEYKAQTVTKPKISRLRRVNYKKIDNFLSNYEFKINANSKDVDYLYNSFAEVLHNLIINFSYYVEITHRSNKNWINNEILNLIKIKAKLYKKHKKYPFDIIHAQNYKTSQKELKLKIKITKQNYYMSEFLKCNNIKKQWKFVNELTKSSEKELKILSKDRNLLAENLNNFFINMGLSGIFTGSVNYRNFLTCQSNSFYLSETNDKEVKNIIISLDDKKACGHDGITSQVLKIAATHHIFEIKKIINLSLSSGVFPTSLKTALVVPIHKSGDTNDISNYRPISLLPIFSKVLEKIVHNRVYNYLKTFNLISDNQYGFLPGLGTEDALINFTKFTYNSIEKNNKTAAVFLDISKAFDSVNHEILIYKLSAMGFRGIVLNWFTSYLKGRKQFVKINDCKSNILTIKSGVPQGSILGPLLFIIYINDFCKLKLNGKIITYADDTVILYSCSNHEILQNNINTDLKTIKYWFDANKLLININKTKYINFSIYGPPEQLSLYYHSCHNENCICPPLQQVNSIRYLGLNVDSNLKWKTHIKSLTNKLRFIIHKFYHIKKIINKNFLVHLYYSWVNSILSYGIIVWGGDYAENTKPLVKIQDKIIKYITSRNTFPLFETYKNLNILPLRHLYFFKTLIYFVKQDNSANVRNLNYNFRSKNSYLIPKVKKEICHKNYFYLAPKFFNILPEDLKNENSIFKFKKILKNYILTTENIEVFF